MIGKENKKQKLKIIDAQINDYDAAGITLVKEANAITDVLNSGNKLITAENNKVKSELLNLHKCIVEVVKYFDAQVNNLKEDKKQIK